MIKRSPKLKLFMTVFGPPAPCSTRRFTLKRNLRCQEHRENKGPKTQEARSYRATLQLWSQLGTCPAPANVNLDSSLLSKTCDIFIFLIPGSMLSPGRLTSQSRWRRRLRVCQGVDVHRVAHPPSSLRRMMRHTRDDEACQLVRWAKEIVADAVAG